MSERPQRRKKQQEAQLVPPAQLLPVKNFSYAIQSNLSLEMTTSTWTGWVANMHPASSRIEVDTSFITQATVKTNKAEMFDSFTKDVLKPRTRINSMQGNIDNMKSFDIQTVQLVNVTLEYLLSSKSSEIKP